VIAEWLKYKTEQMKDFGMTVTSGFVPDEIAEQRYNGCLECKYFKNKKCKVCSCYMPAKVLFKDAVCPKNYWGTYESKID